MRSTLSKVLITLFFTILATIFITNVPNAKAEQAEHVVISEVSIASADVPTDEFVELYNPTENAVDLSGFRLTRKTNTGTESTLVDSISGSIPAHGFFLIAHSDFTGSDSADQEYSEDNSISSNNTILLYSDEGVTLVDKAGFGTAVDSEGDAETNPSNGTSRERKANSLSTSESMGIGGDDEIMGNGEDSDNNAEDFVLRNVPQPQNSGSEIEPIIEGTPTDTPTETPTQTLTPSPTDTPTETPTQTLTPSPTDTPTPTETETPTPTITTTPSPTDSPTPTATVSPSPTPVASFPSFDLVCTTKIKTYKVLFLEFNVPLITCKVVHR